MTKYVVSIRPEYRATFTPDALLGALGQFSGVRIVEGAGGRTVTVESPFDFSSHADRLPELTIRVHRPLSLL